MQPFPGLDPFLEDPIGWPDFHHRFLSVLAEHVTAAASPAYFVRVEERVYVTSAGDDPGYPRLVPDIIVTRGERPGAQGRTSAPAVVSASVVVSELLDPEIHDRYLTVRDARSREDVTAIELLSPANKTRGSRGREAMLEKRAFLCSAGANWLEIDLLRAGERGSGIANRSDYCVLLQRRGHVDTQAWFVDLRDPLPTVAMPLSSSDPDLAIELARTFSVTYDRAGYQHSVDYARPVPPPVLKPADGAWVVDRLAAWNVGKSPE